MSSDQRSGPLQGSSATAAGVGYILSRDNDDVVTSKGGFVVMDPDTSEKLREAQSYVDKEKFTNAVNCYTSALRLGKDPIANLNILLLRSEAYARLCKSILDRPAHVSEEDAIFGLDPSQYAKLSLQDAEAAEQIDSNVPQAHYRKGIAFMLLEHYKEAHDAFTRALYFDPFDQNLREGLKQADAALQSSAMTFSSRKLTNIDDFECTLCLKLLYEPVTTPCGHTFCKSCFLRSTDHGNRCPMCRTVMHVGRSLPVTVTLKNIIEKNFPEEHEQRRLEEVAQPMGTAGEAALPLFVMSIVLPGETIALNIFEPRYRLMVRRCMDGNRRFGMAVRMSTTQDVFEVACECEITECRPLADGRFYLEIIGRRRCKLLDTWEQDGYRVGRPQFLTDEDCSSSSTHSQELSEVLASVDELVNSWIDNLRAASRTRHDYHIFELLSRVEERPPLTDPEAYSFWVARMVPRLDPPSVKLQLLSTRNTCERLRLVREQLVNTTKSYNAGGCCIM